MYVRLITDDLRIAREENRYIQGKYDSVCHELERKKDELRKLETANTVSEYTIRSSRFRSNPEPHFLRWLCSRVWVLRIDAYDVTS